MLKTLIKIRLQGFLSRQMRSSKKSKSGVGKIILMSLLFLYVAVVFIALFGSMFSMMVEPFHALQLDWLYFALMSIVIIALCFVGSVFLVHHEIYEAKDNDVLLSMPIKTSDILLSRVFIILLLNYIYEIVVAGPAIGVYILKIGMTPIQIIYFIIIFLTLPLFVLALTCFFGWILAHVLVHVKQKNIISILLFVVFMLVYMFGITKVEEYMNWMLANGQTLAASIETAVFPIYHLGISLQNENMISLLIYLLFAIIPFGIVMYLLSHNFIKLATTKPKAKKKEYVDKPMKTNHYFIALFIREWKHFTSNAMVMMNGAVGILMSIIALVALFIYRDSIYDMMSQVPMLKPMIAPMICAGVLGLSSMNIISASSISLEGDRLWIIQSLPVKTIDILHSKLSLHLILCIPAGLILSIVGCVMFPVSLWEVVYICLLPVFFTIYIALLGLLLNLWKPKFDWVNETICVKQSMPVMLTMFISMGMVFVLVFVYLNFLSSLSINAYILLLLLFFIVVDIVFYVLLKTWGVRKFDEL